MSIPLLATKLFIPPVRRELVPRPRLVERLNAGLQRKLTLISAPAGFGKTTLLAEWIATPIPSPSPVERGRGERVGVCWLSLDKGDNDPARFWAYFIAALQTIHKGLGATALAALQSTQPPASEALLTSLLNEIAAVPAPFALVLDDFHVITAPQVHEQIVFLLEHLPPPMHLIIASRADPPWPLARLRARGEISELRATDLRFTPEEAAAFLNTAMGLDLSPEDVTALEERTEGWIVGLQMAAISVQGRRQVAGSDVTTFIQAFTGSNRFVLDYLVEEVLAQQTPAIQEFLLQTSILEQMTASLCDAVLGQEVAEVGGGGETAPASLPLDSSAVLAYLERANLFVIPLDDERRWYRYHHLFADLLHNRLQQTQPDQVPILHRRASEWYDRNGLTVDAVSHALATGDVERVAHLVEENALTMIYHGQLATLVGWLQALPAPVMRSRPWLSIAQAWTLAYSGALEAAETALRDAEEALTPAPAGEADLAAGARRERIAGHAATIRGYRAMLTGDMARAAELTRQAMAHLPPDDLKTRGFAALILGVALGMSGDLEAGTRILSEAARTQAAGDRLLTTMILSDLAGLQYLQGQLHAAAATCQEALQLMNAHARRSGRQSPVVGFVYSRLSRVLCEWNDLKAAIRYAREAVKLGQQWGQKDSLAIAYSYLAQALRAAGNLGEALQASQQARQVAGDYSSSEEAQRAGLEMAIRLLQGDVATAARWAEERGLSVRDKLDLSRMAEYGTLASILIAQGQLDAAWILLERLLQVAEAAGAVSYEIGILVLQVKALQARGEAERALDTLERALRLAEPEGYVRVFINEGEAMGKLLRQAAERGIAPAYVGRLLAALAPESGQVPRPGRATLAEPLSERELEVLRLLTTGLSSTEMAQELIVSVNTVRSHVKSIYAKLNVHGRLAAVQRAKELGLLSAQYPNLAQISGQVASADVIK